MTERATDGQRRKKPKTMSVWVGFSDGKPHIYRDDRVHVRGVRLIAVYPSKRAARLEYEDARPMKLAGR